MTAHIPVEVALLVSGLMACSYWAGRISEREKTARKTRNRIAARYQTTKQPNRRMN
jgi:hypothetical protein